MADMRRLLEEKNFSSIEEANEFIEGLMASSGGQIPDVAPRTDVERAQDIMYEAWGTSSRKKRADLAKYALEISPDCADAYALLAAETAKSLSEKADLFEQGVRAGERALGKEFLEEAAGGFWGLIETRPYMRARLGLASSLWGLAQCSAAIEHAREMLRLNPDDNQGVRDVLLEWLLTEGKNEEAGALLKCYEGDASADWLYGRALHALRTGGRSAKADRLLREAMEENALVPAYLLADAAAWAFIDVPPAHPAISAPVALAATGRAKAATNQTIEKLVAAGVLEPISAAKRNRAWEAVGSLEVVEGLEEGRSA